MKPNNDPPPLPWLGDTDQARTNKQPWTISDGMVPDTNDTRLTLIYHWNAMSYFRCSIYRLLLQLPKIAGVTFMMTGIFFGTMGPLMRTSQTLPLRSISSIFVPLFFICWGEFFLAIVFIILFILVIGVLFYHSVKIPVSFHCTTRGLLYEAPGTLRILSWNKVATIEERFSGDIFFLARGWRGTCWAIPRHAFSDQISARQFQADAIALWKANGNPNARVEEA